MKVIVKRFAIDDPELGEVDVNDEAQVEEKLKTIPPQRTGKPVSIDKPKAITDNMNV